MGAEELVLYLLFPCPWTSQAMQYQYKNATDSLICAALEDHTHTKKTPNPVLQQI